VLDIIWFVVGWKDGLKYQGPVYTRRVCTKRRIALLGATIYPP
jgi:hypothetical protein